MSNILKRRYMEILALKVGGDQVIDNIQQECLKYGLLIHLLENVAQISNELSQKKYLMIIIFSDKKSFLGDLESIRRYTKIPVLVIKKQYRGIEKIASIDAGADEYIQMPETISEIVASCHALIRRYTELGQTKQQLFSTISRGTLFINVDYHKVFINFQEMEFPRREFNLLCLLASSPGRVFTNEQLYRDVWGDDYLRDADNGLHSCLNRIRRKLEEAGCTSCRIENIRGVGYRFVQDDT